MHLTSPLHPCHPFHPLQGLGHSIEVGKAAEAALTIPGLSASLDQLELAAPCEQWANLTTAFQHSRLSCADFVPLAADLAWLVAILRRVPNALQNLGVEIVYPSTTASNAVRSTARAPTARSSTTAANSGYLRTVGTICSALEAVAQASTGVCSSAEATAERHGTVANSADASHLSKVPRLYRTCMYHAKLARGGIRTRHPHARGCLLPRPSPA